MSHGASWAQHLSFIIYRISFIICIFSFLSLTACSSDSEDSEDSFPPLITEMGGKQYRVLSELQGMKPHAWGRCLCGYVLKEEGAVEVRTLQNVAVLPNSGKVSPVMHDPVGVVSAWMGGGFVNMHLKKKTKGADHNWGFILDNTYANTAGGTTYEVSLYHNQKDDPTAYSTDVYFSIPEDALSKTRVQGDSVRLSIITFEPQLYHWHFALTY